MEKLLLRTQLAFDNCKKHLEQCNAWGTEIESYLTQHVLVIMCADVQQELYTALEKRAEKAGVIVKSGVWPVESSGGLIEFCHLDTIFEFDPGYHLCQVIETA